MGREMLGRTAVRRVAAVAVRPVARPAMRAAHAEAAAEGAAEGAGWEAAVKKFLPHNHNVVYAVMGMYGSLIGGAIAYSNASAAAEERNAPAPSKPDYHTPTKKTDIPSLADDGFAEWIDEDAGNIELYFKAMEKED